MSQRTVIKKWLASRPQPSAEVQRDRKLIASEQRKAKLEDLRADCRDELQRNDLSPARREAIHALLRESYRAEGYSDDLVFNGGVLRRKPEGT